MTVKTGILGVGGRMGQAIARCLYDQAVPELELTAALEQANHPYLGRDIGDIAGIGPRGVAVTSSLEDVLDAVDVFIDFSFHEASAQHASALAGKGKGLVIGTTGFTDQEQETLQQASSSTPMVLAPNMSLGVNLLFNLARQAARSLKDLGYDVEIVEHHHRRKKDAPSGTALGLGEAVAEGYGWDLSETSVHGRGGLVGERPEKEIGFHAVRGGDAVGDHNVMFSADGEMIELRHRATTRDTFALGALRAARWLSDKPAGLYSMQHVLGLA